MIKLIAVIDSVRGMVVNPPDEIAAILKTKIEKHSTLTLYGGYTGLDELERLIRTADKLEAPVWVLGHATELKLALPYAQELHIIQMDGIFESQEEFPPFEATFYMEKRNPIRRADRIQYQCQVWKPDLTNLKDSWDFDIRDDS